MNVMISLVMTDGWRERAPKTLFRTRRRESISRERRLWRRSGAAGTRSSSGPRRRTQARYATRGPKARSPQAPGPEPPGPAKEASADMEMPSGKNAATVDRRGDAGCELRQTTPRAPASSGRRSTPHAPRRRCRRPGRAGHRSSASSALARARDGGNQRRSGTVGQLDRGARAADAAGDLRHGVVEAPAHRAPARHPRPGSRRDRPRSGCPPPRPSRHPRRVPRYPTTPRSRPLRPRLDRAGRCVHDGRNDGGDRRRKRHARRDGLHDRVHCTDRLGRCIRHPCCCRRRPPRRRRPPERPRPRCRHPLARRSSRGRVPARAGSTRTRDRRR